MVRVRHEEVLRFALLIVLTIALASVAFRIDSHPAEHASSPPRRPAAGPAPPAGPQVLPTQSTRRPGSGTAGAGSSPVAASRPILPVTGRDGTVRLAALAFVLIGGGASLRVAAGRQRR